MDQSGNTIQNANLQEFLDSAKNAADYGQRQFFTPPNFASALFQPLPRCRHQFMMDLNFGSGALARASGANYALGLDIDARVTSDLKEPEGAVWNTIQADLTHWYPLAHEAGFTAPFICINPPFSLRWYSDRLAPLRQSDLPEVAAAIKAHPETIDSTLASFLIALDRLHALGEGFMVCNADTARRFFGPQGTHSALRKYIWLWLDCPGILYEGVNTQFDTAVLYFSRSHAWRGNTDPLHLTAPSGDSTAVLQTLCTPEVFTAHVGSRFKSEYEMGLLGTKDKFSAVADEYARQHKGKRPDWNIRLSEKGVIKTYLTPFQRTSRRLDTKLVSRLHSLNDQTPISLCVTATSRTALREAADCGVWLIHPEVKLAVDLALAEYDREGAPFNSPSETLALGYIDEHSQLRCKAPGIGSCMPGDLIPMSSSIELTKWIGSRINLAGEKERLEYNGRELLIELIDPDGTKHRFHARRDDAKDGKEKDSDQDEDDHTPMQDADGDDKIRHYWLDSLIQHFVIPIPKDITQLRPADYQKNLAAIDQIETMVANNLAKASAA